MRNFLSHELFGKSTLRGATGILIITLFLSNVLGIIRDHYLAQKIPTDALDTYYAAFRIPDFIFNVLILGAISSAFIPIFTSYISKKKEKEGLYISSSFLNIIVLTVCFSVLILFFLMPKLVPYLVPQFNPEKQKMTLSLARFFLLSPIFFGISYILGGILNSFKRFLVYSTAPLIYNLSIISGTLFLADRFSVWGPAFGVILGAFLHMACQYPFAYHLGFRLKAAFDFLHPAILKIGKLMIPRAIGLGAAQVLLLVYTAIASKWTNAVAVFNLADNIRTMPTVVFGTSFATALFPTLAETFSLKRTLDFSSYLQKAITLILYILIPASFGMILLRTQIVRLILGSGFFKWSQTIQTADTLGYFAIALAASGLIPLLAKAFYALHNTKTPTLFAIYSVILSIILAFLLGPKMQILGLALAFSIGSFLNAFLLYFGLLKRISLDHKKIIFSLLKILFCSFLMAIFVQLSKHFIGNLVDMQRFWGVLSQTAGAVLVGLLSYTLFSFLFKLEEIKIILRFKE